MLARVGRLFAAAYNTVRALVTRSGDVLVTRSGHPLVPR